MSSIVDPSEENRDTNTVKQNVKDTEKEDETEIEKANKKIESGNEECKK